MINPGAIQRAAVTAAVCAAAIFLVCEPSAGIERDDADNGLIDCTVAHLNAHNPGLAESRGQQLCFEAYVSDFSTSTTKIGKKKRHFGVPHWVAQRIGRAEIAAETNDRPSS